MGTKKVSAKRPLLKKSLSLSLLVHTALLSLLVWGFWDIIERPAGSGESGFIAVSLVGASPPFVRGGLGEVDLPPPTPPYKGGETLENSLANSQAGTEGGENGSSQTLQKIRSKIERSKYYPLLAKRQNIEGAPIVEFKIDNAGNIEYVRLAQTSGSTLLDEAAQETVKKAAPLPLYPKPISLSLDYALGGR